MDTLIEFLIGFVVRALESLVAWIKRHPWWTAFLIMLYLLIGRLLTNWAQNAILRAVIDACRAIGKAVEDALGTLPDWTQWLLWLALFCFTGPGFFVALFIRKVYRTVTTIDASPNQTTPPPASEPNSDNWYQSLLGSDLSTL